MTALVRAAGLSGYEDLACALGLDVPRELRRVGLGRAQLADPDALIPYVALMNLLEHAAHAAACPDFGLRLAHSQELGILGPLAVLLQHANTVGEAVELASRYIFVHSPAVQFALLPVEGHPGEVDLCFAVNAAHLPPRAQTIELSLGVIAQSLRLLGSGRIRLLAVLLPHARLGPAASYAQLFNAACQFEAPRAAVRIAAAELDLPVEGHNPALKTMAQHYIEQNFGQPEQLVTDRVRALIRRFLASGQTSQKDIAAMLAIHPRTLQRRLHEEGGSFEALTDEVRSEQLLELLRRTHAPPLSQVALMLGYSEQAALTRSCRRWFGCTPSELWRRHAPGAARQLA